MARIAIPRDEKLPDFVTWDVPNFDELFDEDGLLIKGFEERWCQADHVVWNDPQIDWDQFDGAGIRSAYDHLDGLEHLMNI